MKLIFNEARAVHLMSLAADQRPVSGATDADLAVINAMPGVLQPLAADQVYVRWMDAINDQPLKNSLRLGVAEVAQIAQLAKGAPVQCNHDTYSNEALPVATVFASRMETRADGSAWVVMGVYFVAGDEATELVRKIDGGVIKEVSVSFGYDQLLCSICQTDMGQCAHWPGQEYEGKLAEGLVTGVAEFYEVSLVWMGMANGTCFKMAAAIDAIDLTELLAGKPLPEPGGDLAAMIEKVNEGEIGALYEAPIESLL